MKLSARSLLAIPTLLALSASAACGSAAAAGDPADAVQILEGPGIGEPCPATAIHTAGISGSDLSRTAWMDSAEVQFYVFEEGGTFEARTEPSCTRAALRCDISIDARKGTFSVDGSTLELDYEDGDATVFSSTTGCDGARQLTGHDFGAELALTASTIPQ